MEAIIQGIGYESFQKAFEEGQIKPGYTIRVYDHNLVFYERVMETGNLLLLGHSFQNQNNPEKNIRDRKWSFEKVNS